MFPCFKTLMSDICTNPTLTYKFFFIINLMRIICVIVIKNVNSNNIDNIVIVNNKLIDYLCY